MSVMQLVKETIRSMVDRGVQYMHCVMHKCIMVTLGEGNEKHVKYVKTRKFYEIRWEF